jgi:hypothetical protein
MEKFEQNDIIRNTIISYPSYTIDMYNDSIYLNSVSSEGNQQQDKIYLTSQVSSSYFKRYFCRTDGNSDTYPVYSNYEVEPFLNSLYSSMNYYSVKSRYYNQTYYFDTGSNKLLANSYFNLMKITPLLFGTKIRPGTINLEYYFTGSLISSATDHKKNGEIISNYGTTSGSVIGIAFYSEGYILLTSSVALNSESEYFKMPTSSLGTPMTDNPKWCYFGCYQNTNIIDNYAIDSSSYKISFEGVNETQVMTMFAHMPRNKYAWSNNLTFMSSSQVFKTTIDSVKESDKEYIYATNGNITNYSSSYDPQTFLSKVLIYNQNKELLAVCSLSKNTLKRQKDNFSVKMTLDI